MAIFERLRTRSGVDRTGPTALHTQISDTIRATIAAGTWPVGHRLPAEPDLAAELKVSRGTLRRALTTLVDEHLLIQTPGKGTFVVALPSAPRAEGELRGIAEDFARQGLQLTTRVVAAELAVPATPVGAVLHVLADEPVVCLTRVRSADGTPIALLKNYVRADFAPGLEKLDLVSRTLFELIEVHYGLALAFARRGFAAHAATAEVAEYLTVPVGAPVLHMTQTAYLADGRPLEHSDVWIASDEVQVSMVLERPQSNEVAL